MSRERMLGAMLAGAAALETGCGPSEEEAKKERTEIVEQSVEERIDDQAAKLIKQDYDVDLVAWKGRADLGPTDLSILEGLEQNTGWSQARKDLAEGGYYSGAGYSVENAIAVQVPKEIDTENFSDNPNAVPDGMVQANLLSSGMWTPDFGKYGKLAWMGEIENLLEHNVGDLSGEQLTWDQSVPAKFSVELERFMHPGEPKGGESVVALKDRPYDSVYAMDKDDHARISMLFDTMDEQGALDAADYRKELGEQVIALEEKGLKGIGVDVEHSYCVDDMSPNDGRVLTENPRLMGEAKMFLWRQQKIAEKIGDKAAEQRAKLRTAELDELAAVRNGVLLTDALHGFDDIAKLYAEAGAPEETARVIQKALEQGLPEVKAGGESARQMQSKLVHSLELLPVEAQTKPGEVLMGAAAEIAERDPDFAQQMYYELSKVMTGPVSEEAKRRYDAMVQASIAELH